MKYLILRVATNDVNVVELFRQLHGGQPDSNLDVLETQVCVAGSNGQLFLHGHGFHHKRIRDFVGKRIDVVWHPRYTPEGAYVYHDNDFVCIALPDPGDRFVLFLSTFRVFDDWRRKYGIATTDHRYRHIGREEDLAGIHADKVFKIYELHGAPDGYAGWYTYQALLAEAKAQHKFEVSYGHELE